MKVCARAGPKLRRTFSAWRTGVGRTDTLFTGAIGSFEFLLDGKRATVSVVDWLSGLTITQGVHRIVAPKRR